MKKYIKHFSLVILFIFALSSLMYNCFTQDVSTVYKREMFINRIKPGTKILSEKEIDRYIISGFELSSNEYGLAVFKPEKNHHKFQSCIYSKSGAYVSFPLTTSDKNYLVIWHNNPDVKQALVYFYNENEVKLDYVSLDLSNQTIIVYDMPFNNFSFKVEFYDKFGKIIN